MLALVALRQPYKYLSNLSEVSARYVTSLEALFYTSGHISERIPPGVRHWLEFGPDGSDGSDSSDTIYNVGLHFACSARSPAAVARDSHNHESDERG
jgi:hypothetical protein